MDVTLRAEERNSYQCASSDNKQ